MDSLALKLNPFSRLKVYAAIRSAVRSKMDRNEITPQRAMEIIQRAKAGILNIKSGQMAISFCEEMSKNYPELQNLTQIFEKQSLEQFDRVITFVIDKIMEKDNIELADELLSKLEKSPGKGEKEKLIKELQDKYPQDFEEAIMTISNSKK